MIQGKAISTTAVIRNFTPLLLLSVFSVSCGTVVLDYLTTFRFEARVVVAGSDDPIPDASVHFVDTGLDQTKHLNTFLIGTTNLDGNLSATIEYPWGGPRKSLQARVSPTFQVKISASGFESTVESYVLENLPRTADGTVIVPIQAALSSDKAN